MIKCRDLRQSSSSSSSSHREHSQKHRYVAIKIIKNVQRYREAAEIEISVLDALKKHDPSNRRCVRVHGVVCVLWSLCE